MLLSTNSDTFWSLKKSLSNFDDFVCPQLYFSRGFYPVSLSTPANFKVGLVYSSSFHYPGLFLGQQLSKLALFVLVLSILPGSFFRCSFANMVCHCKEPAKGQKTSSELLQVRTRTSKIFNTHTIAIER
jgi:hypothetical protein